MPSGPITVGVHWRTKQREGVVVELPSGMIARVRGVQPDMVIRMGRLPDGLTPLIAKLMENRRADPDAEDLLPKTLEELSQQLEFMRAVCECALLEPRIVVDPQADDEIAYDDLEWADKELLAQMVLVPLTRLEQFRYQPPGDVESVDAPGDDGATRQPDHEDLAVGPADDGA